MTMRLLVENVFHSFTVSMNAGFVYLLHLKPPSLPSIFLLSQLSLIYVLAITAMCNS